MDTTTARVSGEGQGPASPRSLWSDIPPVIIGLVLRRLCSAVDHASVSSVCSNWRAAAHLHPSLLRPLPMLVYEDFKFITFFTEGVMGAIRQMILPWEKIYIKYPCCIGSLEGWMVCASRNRLGMDPDGVCFLVNPFTSVTTPLPDPIAFHDHGELQRSVPIINGQGGITYTICAPEYALSLSHAVLSASPDSAASCIIAGMSLNKTVSKLALCQPGMASWSICVGSCISKRCKIEFYHGTLYLLNTETVDLFAFVHRVHDDFIQVVQVEQCVVDKPPPCDAFVSPDYDLVQACEKLLLLVRYYDIWDKLIQVKVFELDFKANPYRWREISSLDGESILVSPCSSNSFPASQYDGIEDDHIYFVDKTKYSRSHYVVVYNMRDETINQYPVKRSNYTSLLPFWFFPSQSNAAQQM